ncbi:MAG TPA: hypothetical protein VLA56_16340 [Pseudomonadales bacterium]|nr:hypothetical protein [Pseudomonadales bacterium]
MATREDSPDDDDGRASAAVAELYHAWFTALILTLIGRRDAALAERFVFTVFRRQHLAKFLPGLAKLGLADAPDAVAAASYHYYSNQLGGVRVELFVESPRKAWVRYPPPRWIWSGTAIAAVPTEVNRAMLRAWHAHNGVSLNNPRLGFVCTKTTTDGQPGLEGYYLEHDRELAPEERLRFAPDESCPPIDPATLPALDADAWPEARRRKASRNYAMEYLRTGLPVLVELLGAEDGGAVGALSARLTGMHFIDAALATLGLTIPVVSGADRPGLAATAAAFARAFAAMATAQGDEVRIEEQASVLRITQRGWRLAHGMAHADAAGVEAVASAWNGLWAGALSAVNRHLQWHSVTRRGTGADTTFVWEIRVGPG